MIDIRWWFRRPFGLVPRAYLKQIDTERAHWQRWCEEVEALLPPDPDNKRYSAKVEEVS